MIPEISMILRQQAALVYLTFPVILQLLRVLLESLAAILARSLTHGTLVACCETVLKTISYRYVWRTCVSKRRETRSEN